MIGVSLFLLVGWQLICKCDDDDMNIMSTLGTKKQYWNYLKML